MPRNEPGSPRRNDDGHGRQALPNLIMVCVCLLMIWLGAAVRRPYLIAGRMEAENLKDEARVLELKLKNQDLRKQVQSLDTPAGMEREARRLGYVKPGEALLVVPK